MSLPLPHALAACVLIAAGTLTAALPANRASPAPPVPLADYLEIRRVRDASFSHDERLIAYRSDEGGRPDVWVQPVSGGPAVQVTRATGVIHAFAFSPAEDLLLYETDEGGNDETRLYLTDSRGAAPTALMPGVPKGSRVGFIRWAPDGRSFLYIVSLPGEAVTELRTYDLASRQTAAVWKTPANLSFALANRTFTRFVLLEVLSEANFNLYLLERGRGEPVLITPHENDAAYTPTAFSPDGQTLYYTSTGDGEFTTLRSLDLRTKRSTIVLKEDWDVDTGEFSQGGTYFVTVTNADGTPAVGLTHVASGRRVQLPAPAQSGAFVPVAFSRSDRYAAATLVSDTAPESLYVVDLQKKTARQVRDVLPPSLQDRRMVAGESVRIPSFDGREVPALLYRPAGTGPFPAIVEVHGGPTAQAKRAFSGVRQYFVSKGYVVLVPNVRGSTGYGKSYAALDNLDLGGGPLRDVIAGKEWLARHAGVDPARVAIMGASYGGYMALAAAAFTPGQFAAHVDYFGISDLKSLVESYPAYWKVYSPFTYKKYGDPANPDHAAYQRDRSPANFTHRITGPLLIVQGENDARVKKDQSDRIVDALRTRDVPVHYLVVPGEGHGFSRNENRLKAYEATDRFLDRYLRHDTSTRVLP